MYDQTIDVATIMREIKSRVAFPDITQSAMSSDTWQIKKDSTIYTLLQQQVTMLQAQWLHSINLAENIRMQGEKYMVPGAAISVGPRFKGPLRKLAVLCKRTVRFLTRFIINDISTFNQQVNAQTKALCEAQKQLAGLFPIIETLLQTNAMLEEKVKSLENELAKSVAQLNELNDILTLPSENKRE